jgi:hypothetical protein
MNAWNRWVAAGVWGVLAAGAHAQGLRPDTMAMFGGRYAADCARADSPRVVVEARQMHVEQGNQRMTVGNLDASASYFGNRPPSDFRIALFGQVQGQHELTALVSADTRGQYLKLDGDRTVMTNLGALGRTRFRHCNEAANRQAAADQQAAKQAEEAARAPVAPGMARSASELARDTRFKPLYQRALGPLARTPWLAEMHGPAPDLSKQRIGGVEYVVAAFCKPHDCFDHNAVVLYDQAQGRVYGLVQQTGKQRGIGSPPGPMLLDLHAIWRREFRQGK